MVENSINGQHFRKRWLNTVEDKDGHDVPEKRKANGPYLRIKEEPVEKFRFRYKSEMVGTHGCISSRSTAKSKAKLFPAVELCNYKEPAIIRCSLYTAHPDESERVQHTHRLAMKIENRTKYDPIDIVVPHEEHGYTAVFPGLSIVNTAKKFIAEELIKKKRNQHMELQRLKNINASCLTFRVEQQIRQEAEIEAKNMNLNSVTLCFEALRTDVNGVSHSICRPIFSKSINNMKSALTGELKICRIDKHVSSCLGGEEVFILVEKVCRKNIKIKFYELDEEENEVWYDYAKFSELDVHHQFAIVFRTPPYRDLEIKTQVEVFMQLYRPTDGSCSEPVRFVYKPSHKTGRSRRANRSALIHCTPVVVQTDPRNFVNGTSGTEQCNNNTENHFITTDTDSVLSPATEDLVQL